MDENAAAWAVLVALLLAGAVYLFLTTRGSSFWSDEWSWILERRAWDASVFLEPHNGHLSLVPVALYKLLFSTVGLDHYGPYRALVLMLHIACVLLLFLYARRRVRPFLALLVSVPLLFLGPAWQNFIWPFQVAWLISMAAAIGALMLLDRRDRPGDIGAAILLGASLSSSGLGVPVALAMTVELVLGVQRRRLWVVAAPLAVYGVWYLGFGEVGSDGAGLSELPGFVGDSFAAAVAALTGLAGDTIPDRGGILDWGRPLAVAASLLATFALVRRGNVPSPRLVGLVVAALAFWSLTCLARGELVNPYESRYLYVGALLVLLVVIELVRDVAVPSVVVAGLGFAVALSVVSNLGALGEGATFLRAYGDASRARLGALELVRDQVPGGFYLDPPAGFPAKAYFTTVDDYGSPAATASELAAQGEPARRAADDVLRRVLGAELALVSAVPPLGGAAPSGSASGGERTTRSCLRSAVGGDEVALDIELPASGLLLTGPPGARVWISRLASEFWDPPVGRLPRSGRAVVRLPRDRIEQPWRVRLAGPGPLAACRLA